jgi:hypothetical protein
MAFDVSGTGREEAEKLEACRAYARMMNTMDASAIEPFLLEGLVYDSQSVWNAMSGKRGYMEYIRGKIETIKRTGATVYAEIAYSNAFGYEPCVILAQGNEDNWVGTLLIKMEGSLIRSMCMCIIPSPYECKRTFERPGALNKGKAE